MEHVRDSVPLLVESKDGDVVALANGLFDLRSKELRPFSPEVVLTSKASVAFREDATTCPVIDGWSIDEWIRELANDDPEVERLFWRIIAALFRPGHAFNKAVLLYSSTGSNGKGTFVELLRNLVGAGRAATLSISDFGGPFLPETLRSAFCVLSDENEVGDFLRRAGVFKAWVTHDWIQLNVKYGQMRDIKGRGLCVFCVNELPSSKDKSESFYRRFVAIPFLKRYTGANENTAIKHDYVRRTEVLEYVARKALMLPLFDAFVTPSVCETCSARFALRTTRYSSSPKSFYRSSDGTCFRGSSCTRFTPRGCVKRSPPVRQSAFGSSTGELRHTSTSRPRAGGLFLVVRTASRRPSAR